MQRQIDGILLLDKPYGLSSNKALQKVKRLFNAKKAGHTGSLDPLATGMLPICFGNATKFSQFMLDADKGYSAVGVLGKCTTTQDAEGDVVAEHSTNHISEDDLKLALQHHTGTIQQIPSMYSALKKDGVPLYKLARQGIEIERKARTITIHSLQLIAFERPYFKIKVICSKGTYIRNLVEDIGNYLKVGAYVDKLHRDFSKPFSSEPMLSLEQLEQVDNKQQLLLPISSMVEQFPEVLLTEHQQQKLYYGQAIDLNIDVSSDQYYRLVNHLGQFLGLGQYFAPKQLKAKRLIQQF